MTHSISFSLPLFAVYGMEIVLLIISVVIINCREIDFTSSENTSATKMPRLSQLGSGAVF